MEHATFEGREVTAVIASEVVACSSTIRSLGKEWAILVRWVRKCFSALRIEIFYVEISLCSSRINLQTEGDSKLASRLPDLPAHLLVIARYLSVQIQNHVRLLHRLEHRVVYLVIFNPRSRIGSDSPRI